MYTTFLGTSISSLRLSPPTAISRLLIDLAAVVAANEAAASGVVPESEAVDAPLGGLWWPLLAPLEPFLGRLAEVLADAVKAGSWLDGVVVLKGSILELLLCWERTVASESMRS